MVMNSIFNRSLSMILALVLIFSMIVAFPTVSASDYDEWGDFSYEEDYDGGVIIIKYNGPGGDVEIPAEIEGYPVTGIGGYQVDDYTVFGAFENCSSITSVTIPDSVTWIGDGSFRGCESLETIDIPSSVTSIGYNAFEGCVSLTSVTIPDGVTNI